MSAGPHTSGNPWVAPVTGGHVSIRSTADLECATGVAGGDRRAAENDQVPPIAVILTTYNPRPDLLGWALESLRR